MPINSHRARILVVCTVMLISVIFFALHTKIIWNTYGNVVTVNNTGSSAITDVCISYNGGECKVTKLPAMSSRALLINVLGASGIMISFVDSKGRTHGESIGVYLEPNLWGETIINIDASNKVSFENKNLFLPQF